MANRIDATLSGVDSPKLVSDAWSKALEGNTKGIDAIAGLSSALCKVSGDDQATKAVIAVMCSVLNINFIDTGRLYSVSATGQINYQYFSSGAERTLVASLLSD